MNTASRWRQVWTIVRLQLRRVFFSRRSFWVYLLALFPAFIFLMRGLQVKYMEDQWADRIAPVSVLESIHEGDTDEEVLNRAGEPLNDNKSLLSG